MELMSRNNISNHSKALTSVLSRSCSKQARYYTVQNVWSSRYRYQHKLKTFGNYTIENKYYNRNFKRFHFNKCCRWFSSSRKHLKKALPKIRSKSFKELNDPKFITNYSVKHRRLPPHFIGQNTIERANSSQLRDFIKIRGGHTVISKILIANNGIAAVKMIRSIRKWAYETFGEEKAFRFVVMATPEDLDANSEYIRMADQYVEVPGGTNNHNYANVDLIVDIAERFNVDAVWAGWGHASENQHLPEKLAQSRRKIVFIGPPSSAIRNIGDKVSSLIVAQHAKVPCFPWSGSDIDSVKVDSKSGLVSVEKDLYFKACCSSPEDGLIQAKKIGFPVMIKASEGGGGKGIRQVRKEEDFIRLYHQAVNEIPGSPMFIMKLAEDVRHLEVQLLADQYGTNITLFGRDCSVQRRHQKIIEEAPITIASQAKFEKMAEAAIRLGKLVGYVSAGTVEYLYSSKEDQAYFLELNPRLQVEHPTTEMITGVNLPAAQLQIAMGIPMHRIGDIRHLYGYDAESNSVIDFSLPSKTLTENHLKPKPKGHCISCRITAEDPDQGFKPSGGLLEELNFRSSFNVWGYFSVANKGKIHSYSDSQFGHIFAFGENRQQARKRLIVSLKELSLRGEFKTTVEYLIKLLESEDFEDNKISTGWLDDLISQKITSKKPEPILAALCAAATKAHIASKVNHEQYTESLRRGIVQPENTMLTEFQIEFLHNDFKYKFTVTKSSVDTYILELNNSKCELRVRELSDGGLLISLGGKSHTIYWKNEVDSIRLTIDSMTTIIKEENDPTQLRTPSPGKLVKYLVENGAHINVDEPYAEVEIMKMQMPLLAPAAGTIHILKSPGSTISKGELVATLTLDDVKMANPTLLFKGRFPNFGTAVIEGTKLAHRFQYLYYKLNNLLYGYDTQDSSKAILEELLEVLRNPALPYSEWQLQLSGLHPKIPKILDIQMQQIVTTYSKMDSSFPAVELRKKLEDAINEKNSDSSMKQILEPLYDITESYLNGIKEHEYSVIIKLLGKYYDTERLFIGDKVQEEHVILKLRDENRKNLKTVSNIVLSHSKVLRKNELVMDILKYYYSQCHKFTLFTKLVEPTLINLTKLGNDSNKVSLFARKLLIQCSLPSLKDKANMISSVISRALGDSKFLNNIDHPQPDLKILEELIECDFAIFDSLFPFLVNDNTPVANAAANVYIRRAYRDFVISDLKFNYIERECIWSWNFKQKPEFTELFPNISSFTTESHATRENDLSKNVFLGIEGILTYSKTFTELHSTITSLLAYIKSNDVKQSTTNGTIGHSKKRARILLLYVDSSSYIGNEEDVSSYFESILQKHQEQLKESNITQLTLIVGNDGKLYPKYFTFNGIDCKEEKALRNTDPAMVHGLEIGKMAKFNISQISTGNATLHIFKGISKTLESDIRYFARGIIRKDRSINDFGSIRTYLRNKADKLVNEMIDGLEVTRSEQSTLTHIFLHFSDIVTLSLKDLTGTFDFLFEKYLSRLNKLKLTNIEIKIAIREFDKSTPLHLRIIIENPSGFVTNSQIYQEILNSEKKWIFKSIGNPGPLNMMSIYAPYPQITSIQQKRQKVQRLGTSYVFDFPLLFEHVVINNWKKNFPIQTLPSDMFTCCELIEDASGNLVESNRAPGNNQCGMVAFKISMKTPEYKDGRYIVIIANDLSYQMGSFGPIEDKFFNNVTEYCLKHGLPRIYLSANSGARIGITEELVPLLNVDWKDLEDVTRGFNYLYLTESSFNDLKRMGKEKTVELEKITKNGEIRYIIKAIIGSSDDFGVESLKGSGLIAGTTSRAYRDIFTITLVTGRSVGIGAYLVRLGQRTIQVENKPIILTGAAAINKVLGRDVYSSNLQIGGSQIMYKNGISHLVSSDDLAGVESIVKWLSYIPKKRNNPVPIVNSPDSWDRDVQYSPSSNDTYDIRWLIRGRTLEGIFEHGLFDKDSFFETLSGWANGVVVGRARLGGIPVGVIGVDVRTVETVIPADPANPKSMESITHEAGQVWYPNSAFKTAQTINDFNYGEQLPLIILANWRGFSGGQQDMYREILKYGSFIVDSLNDYKQPVMIYIPPNGELRGGSWVVMEPSINPDHMELYADVTSRASVLEPEGMVGIKFRRNKLLKTMSQLDEQYRSLQNELLTGSLSSERYRVLANRLQNRENEIMPVYKHIAAQFFDLHDKTSRMLAKNVIKKELVWVNSRRFLFWRLKRKLQEEYILRTMESSLGDSPRKDVTKLLYSWYPLDLDVEDDRSVVTWLDSNTHEVEKKVKSLKTLSMSNFLTDSIEKNHEESLSGILSVLQDLPNEDKSYIIGTLTKSINKT
ncbi:hypothetical protein TPHA_0D03740 [Tetrapisispora phaffii CBS 4417]|uniref:Uncharacterized protein n=1 Tax=Tetrapisispora phaffii (strain ATCC 24235 / CBS 4417 / NBRC 1672 / NRRL Y-8282 / UCD 70-5) TaxID=1071381 RepID=G8BT37_TETPH|nr:hypothetical protein TPHA_0D03740 [Tetrapisispora phaffii CBS 4417]CCE63008.1 hypothetical protein TPHA_0D03740 [Tetrapisispora phaffii CBS 4417]